MPQRPEFTDALPLPGGYVAALLGGRFVVVDVRRARERILYEDYLRMLGNGSSVSQQLLFPERLVLSGDEYALLEENAVEFAALGFDIDFCGEGTVEVRGTPADMPADAVDRLLFDLLQAFATPVSLSDVRREKIAGVVAAPAPRVRGGPCRARRPRRCSHSWPTRAVSVFRPRARRSPPRSRRKICAPSWDNPAEKSYICKN